MSHYWPHPFLSGGEAARFKRPAGPQRAPGSAAGRRSGGQSSRPPPTLLDQSGCSQCMLHYSCLHVFPCGLLGPVFVFGMTCSCEAN